MGLSPICFANIMKLKEITPTQAIYVTTVDDEEYVRFGPETWFKWYGNTLEYEYHDEEKLEVAYQEFTTNENH